MRDSVVLPENNYEWANHTFLYWGTSSDDVNSFHFAPGTKFRMENIVGSAFDESNELTFYALWWDNNRICQIIFDGNGATEGENDTIYYNISNFNDLITLPDCGFINPGDTFMGWSNNRYGSSLNIQPGTTITPQMLRESFRNSDTLTTYVNWQKDSTWTFTFDGNGATSGSTVSISDVRDNSNVSLPQCGFKKKDILLRGGRLLMEVQFYPLCVYLLENHFL